MLRNIPLVVLLALIGLLFWPTESKAEAADGEGADAGAGKPNGAHAPVANGLHREAAEARSARWASQDGEIGSGRFRREQRARKC